MLQKVIDSINYSQINDRIDDFCPFKNPSQSGTASQFNLDLSHFQKLLACTVFLFNKGIISNITDVLTFFVSPNKGENEAKHLTLIV